MFLFNWCPCLYCMSQIPNIGGSSHELLINGNGIGNADSYRKPFVFPYRKPHPPRSRLRNDGLQRLHPFAATVLVKNARRTDLARNDFRKPNKPNKCHVCKCHIYKPNKCHVLCHTPENYSKVPSEINN